MPGIHCKQLLDYMYTEIDTATTVFSDNVRRDECL